MSDSFELIKQVTDYMKAAGVASFEMDGTGVLKVSFDPRNFVEPTMRMSKEELKVKIGDLFTDSEKARKDEEDLYL